MVGRMGAGDAQREPERPATNLGGSIAISLLCCPPFGIIALVYGLQVIRRWNAKDIDGARHASDMAEKWMYAGIGLFVILFVISRILAVATGTGRIFFGRF